MGAMVRAGVIRAGVVSEVAIAVAAKRKNEIPLRHLGWEFIREHGTVRRAAYEGVEHG